MEYWFDFWFGFLIFFFFILRGGVCLVVFSWVYLVLWLIGGLGFWGFFELVEVFCFLFLIG